ncbi:glycosyltransferase [Clostridiales bacterium FE2010]|nr:glycosyltransferase [Clostridiales bacterium FE2010]
MKITIVKESLCLGGTERSAANISLALAQKHDVDLVLYDGSNIQYKYGGILYNMNIPTRKSRFYKFIDHYHRVCFFLQYLNKKKPDVVFLFVSFRHPIAKLRMRKTIKIISARDFSVLSTNIQKIKERLNNSDGLICNSLYMKEYYVTKYPEDYSKVFSVWNIIDTFEIRKQAEKPIDNEQFRIFREKYEYLIVSVGRFCAEKAFEYLITAFKKCTNERKSIGLVLVGDGEYKNKYLSLIQEYDISENVFFTGFQQNPYQYMHRCDLFVLSSTSEGFPNVLAEAMALSLPVISVNCFSGPAEILLHKHNYDLVKDSYINADYGLLVPHYSAVGIDQAINEMAKAIIYLLENSEVRKKYAQLAYERSKKFSAEESTMNLEMVFDKLLKMRRTE